MPSYQLPVLPTYLADMYQLRTIVDAPSNEEVMTIQAVIRSLEGTSHLPGLYDANLAVELSQHLFDAQMARYRDRHSFTIFPMDVTYAPPQLPTHISVAMEPVKGPPSDEQIKAVQTALRASEGLSSVPRLFDANLSMELSQHLFDLQMARCIQRSSRGQDSSDPVRSEAAPERHSQANVEASSTLDGLQQSPPSRDIQANSESNPVSSTSPDIAESTEVLDNSPMTHATEHAKTVYGQSDLILTEIRDIMVDVKQILVATEHAMTRGLASQYRKPDLAINSKGELPARRGLPELSCQGYTQLEGFGPGNLAGFLRFYSIGDEYLEEGDPATLKEGTYKSAAALLSGYLLY